jgi:TonB-linked SusC/RagA family outer membrane protein
MLQKLQIARLFVLIFLLGSVMSQVYAQGSPVLYASSANRTTAAPGIQTHSLIDLLKDLEDKYNVVFDYDKRSLKGKHITVTKDQLANSDVAAMLNTILPSLGLQYKKYSERSYIIFEPKEEKNSSEKKSPGNERVSADPSVSSEVFSEERESSAGEKKLAFMVSGAVTDDLGSTMPGVNVVIKGTTVGTSTDSDGKYKLDVPDGNATLTFSFIGYETQDVTVNNRTVIDVSMLPDINTLSEIVVVGYGTVKKRDLTGAVNSAKADDILRTPTHNAVEALQGRIAGMDIVRSSGAAGAGTNVVIRGNKSITADKDKMVERNSPLYIIDGNQLPLGSGIGDMNPSDIESIDVLKDASATAIYGALGANGVVIVTTKKGAEGRTKVSYNGYYGVNYYSFPKGRVGDEYLQLRREAYRTVSEWSGPADDLNLFPETSERQAFEAGQWIDWVDLVKQNGMQQSHSVSVASGTEKTKIFASLGYFKEEGMLRNNDFTRYNARFNIDQTLSKWAKTGIMTQLTYADQNRRFDPLSTAISISPLGEPYGANGVIKTFISPGVVSPLADEKNGNIARDNTIRANVLANGYLELTPFKGLTFRTNFGANVTFSRLGIYKDKESFSNAKNAISTGSSESDFDRFYNWDNILTYTKDFADHTITVTGITSYTRSDADGTDASGSRLLASSQLFYGLNGSIAGTIGSPYVGWKNMAYAGRVNYSYRGKYLLTATGRYDGASRLSPGNKWAFFPSVAVGWNIIDEPFLANVETVSNLKLRGSYGISGNYAISVYGTQSGLDPGRNMSFGEVSAPLYKFKPSIGNPDLGWETSATTNIGLDIGVLKERITASVDVYKTITSDILMERQLPLSSGVGTVYQNIAETENRGIEITVTSKNIVNESFKWNTTLTFFSNQEKITALIDGRDILKDEDESLLLGRPINSFYTFNKQGIWQADEADIAMQYRSGSATGTPFQPGDIKLLDVNKDFIINADSDRMYIGSAVPKWVMGMQNTFYYKGFDLGIFALARFGQMINAKFLGRYNPSGEANAVAGLEYWTPENPTNDYPRPRKGAQLNSYTGFQSLGFVDGSFFKIRTVTLGYTLPAAVLEKVSISKVRFYVTGTNLWIKAKSHLLEDYDPERGGEESFPLSRQVIFGVNVDF